MDKIKQLSIKTLMPEADISKLNRENLWEVRNLLSLEENSKEATEDESYGLSSRRKHEYLSLDQILFIKSMFENIGISIKQLQLDYNISYSVANKIKRSTLNLQNKISWRKITKVYGTNKEILVKSIKEYVLNIKNTLTAQEVTMHINRTLNTFYSVSFIRKIIKNEANLSFKRVKSRPNNIDLKRLSSIRNLFTIKFSKIVTENTLLISIDESSINISVKLAYQYYSAI